MQNEAVQSTSLSRAEQGRVAKGRLGRLCARLHTWFDRLILGLCHALVGHRASGRLRLTLPSGAVAVIGGGAQGVEADLTLTSYGVFWNGLRRGTIGFAESIIAGDCESSDLPALFRYFIDNKRVLHTAGRGHFRVRTSDRDFHARRANTREGARENIAAHYDLGNAFYRRWLDASMTYSGALYAPAGISLEEAQQAKIARVLDSLELQDGHRLLEIGCGWGAFAAAAAARGASVTGLTLSHEQFTAAVDRMKSDATGAKVEIRIEDYRDTGDTFDRVVSIEMIEAVGEENWPHYFSTIHDRLAPGGVAVLQAITIDEAHFETYRRKADFIQRDIFPGGMLPTEAAIAHHAAAAALSFERVATFGASYALTLIEWRRRFHAAWPQIQALGFDERFRRTWDYYLAYCQAGFERGTIDVGIYRLRKPATDIATRARNAATKE